MVFEVSTERDSPTPFEIQVTENYSFAMLPLGKVVKVELLEEEIRNFKIVNSNTSYEKHSLFIESLWGISNITLIATNQADPNNNY